MYRGKTVDPFYVSAAWRRLRVRVLIRDHYWCQMCRRRAANTVHHKIPITQRPDLALDEENCESICSICHNQEHPEKGGPGQKTSSPQAGIRVIEIR